MKRLVESKAKSFQSCNTSVGSEPAADSLRLPWATRSALSASTEQPISTCCWGDIALRRSQSILKTSRRPLREYTPASVHVLLSCEGVLLDVLRSMFLVQSRVRNPGLALMMGIVGLGVVANELLKTCCRLVVLLAITEYTLVPRVTPFGLNL